MALRDDKIFSAVRLFQASFGGYKGQIIILVILGFLTGLLEGVGVNAVIPLFSFVTDSQDQVTDTISRLIRQSFAAFNLEFSLTSLIIFIITLFVLKALASFSASYVTAKINTHYERQRRSELFKKTLAADWAFLMQQKIGYLEKILEHDIGGGAVLLRYLTDTILLVTSLTMYTLIALNISVLVTLITLACGAVLFLILKPIAFWTRRVSQTYTDTLKQVAHHINEKMIGIKSVKAAAIEAPVVAEGDHYFRQLEEFRIKTALYNNAATAFIQPIAVIFICVLFVFSYRSATFGFASFAVIIYLVQKIFTYIQAAQGKLQNINELIPYLRSVDQYNRAVTRSQETELGSQPFAFNNSIEFRKVTFAYNQDTPVLTTLNFSLVKGELVGLVGPSGAGKTTIVDLLLRLLKPQAGQIMIDNTDIRQIDINQWRSNIGYVSQDIFLVNDTIERNIKFYNQSITDEQMIAAARMANIYDFIDTQKEKFLTMVGERGLQLSAGQRQRIILARMLARQPKILILDEATSALDNESEVLIQQAIENLKGKITVLAIAHRLSTIMNSDRIIVLENGQISEQGSADELLKKKNSYFYKVYNIRGGENTDDSQA